MGNKKVITILTLIFSMGVVVAQDNNADSILMKVSGKYQNADQLYMEQEVSFYETYTTKKAYETASVFIKKQQDQLYIKRFDQEEIVDKGLNLIIDHKAHFVMVNLIDKQTLTHNVSLDLVGLKKWSYESNYQQVDNRTGKYTFHFKVGDHAKSEIWINTTTYDISKIIYFMRKPVPMNVNEPDEKTAERELPRVEINIKKINANPNFLPEEFNWKQFISISDDQITLTEKYQDYTLINNIEQ